MQSQTSHTRESTGSKTAPALVLGGGGSRGAYHIGAYEALCELGFSFSLVTGVSIGALNGAMIVQGDFARAKSLWENLSLDQVIDQGLNLTTELDYYFANSQKLLPFLKAYTQNKGMDTAPLWNIITSNLDYTKLAASPLDYGTLALEVPSFQPCEQTKASLTESSLPHWVMASASCFPAFPIYEIDGRSYIDGGYYDNLPIDLAFKMGAREVIAISLHHDYISKYDSNPLVRHIRPSRYLGTILDFTRESIARNMRLGYLDVRRYFGSLIGRIYAFTPLDSAQAGELEKSVAWLLCDLLQKELDRDSAPSSPLSRLNAQLANTGIISKITSTTPFCDTLLERIDSTESKGTKSVESPRSKGTRVNLQDILIALTESYMQLCGYDDGEIYSLPAVLESARASFAGLDSVVADSMAQDFGMQDSARSALAPRDLREILGLRDMLKHSKPESALFDKHGEKLWCALLALMLEPTC